MKKIIGLLLTLAMLASMAIVPGAVMALDEEVGIVLTLNTGDSIVPPGTNVTVSATVSGGHDAAAIKFYESGNLVSTITELNGEIEFKVTSVTGTKPVYAELISADGNVLAASNTLMVVGYSEKLATTMWDIDFEDEYFHTIADYPEYRYLYGSNDSALSINYGGAKSTLTAHTGNTSNDMAIVDTGDATHGKAVKFTTASDAQNQFNEFKARNAGAVVVGQWDYMLETIPERKSSQSIQIMLPFLATTGAGNGVASMPYIAMLYKDGVPYIGWTNNNPDDIVYYCPIETNVWYNVKTYIDFTTGVISYYINNDFVASHNFDKSTLIWSEKFRASFLNASGSTAWVDNFKVTQVYLTDVTPKVTLIDGSYGSEIVAGSKVRLGLDIANGDNFATYKLFTANDGVNFKEVLTTDGKDGYVLAEVSQWPASHMVKAYDANGNVLAMSNIVTVSGKKSSVKSSIWNVDFDTADIFVIASGDNRYLSADGVNALKPNGDSMGMNVGDADNTITVESSSEIESGINGKSLVFTTNGNAGTCQINSGWAKISSGIAVYSVDVATTNYASKTLLTGAAAKAAGGNQWMTTVETRPDGRMLMYLRSQDAALRAPGVTKITSGADAGYTLVGTYETNKWYNVKFVMNIEVGTLDVYINDTYIATDYERVSPTMTPARFQLSNGSSDGSLYVDNIKAYTMTYEIPENGFESVDYSINNEKAEAIGTGALNVTANITNDGNATDNYCYVAVYDDDQLVRLYVKEVKFAEGETHCTVSFNAGNVTADMKVKTMLWESDFITPVCASSILQ